MITLHTFKGRDGLESISPFCMKLEVYLKLTQQPYKSATGNPRRSPKGKMPFIENDDGSILTDSNMIIEHFEKQSAHPLDEGMTSEEIARAHVVRRMLEEAVYFVLLWTRWVDDRGWALTKSAFDMIPGVARWAILPIIRRSVAKSTIAQGTGRHSPDEIYAMGKQDLDALCTLLDDRPFFTGEKLRLVDITAYAFLANILKFDADTPLREAAKNAKNLVAFVDRVAARVTAAVAAAKPTPAIEAQAAQSNPNPTTPTTTP